MSTIGQRLRHARDFRGFNREQLNQGAGLPPGTVAQLEAAARLGARDVEHIPKLAAALGVRPAWLHHEDSGGEASGTIEERLRRVPQHIVEIYGRPAVLIASAEAFPELVMGSAEHTREMGLLVEEVRLRGHGGPTSYPAWMLPQLDNPMDQVAVRVVIGELAVGRLPREVATSWHPILRALEARHGRHVACRAEVSCRSPNAPGAIGWEVHLMLPVRVPHIIVTDLRGAFLAADDLASKAGTVMRDGEPQPIDEVREARSSGNLQRMVAVLDKPMDPVDRHFLLLGIVDQAYRSRKIDPAMRALALHVGALHVREFEQLAPVLADKFKDAKGRPSLPQVPTFQHLATLLGEDGRIDEAVVVCEAAMRHGLDDGTKGGYVQRIARLRKQREK